MVKFGKLYYTPWLTQPFSSKFLDETVKLKKVTNLLRTQLISTYREKKVGYFNGTGYEIFDHFFGHCVRVFVRTANLLPKPSPCQRSR